LLSAIAVIVDRAGFAVPSGAAGQTFGPAHLGQPGTDCPTSEAIDPALADLRRVYRFQRIVESSGGVASFQQR